ncbi:MAG: hypothetical protein CVT88_04025 [Candidatus Altiarchaeales archaeon HGW-Altiarchaeales-1]|nr:MAG: hypothetical protein CVT88_04025 [Candidatus Altiarchaeales archaeon HGW-Altiarchaeales-1]
METITFYSYKGGVGRTLALANVAIYLSRFGKDVCIMDFDLEAPGLHYKFPKFLKTTDIKAGLVDCIYKFSHDKTIPESLNKFSLEVIPRSKSQGKIQLIPAGNVISSHYWKRLALIDWHSLFYEEHSEGVPFFIELKERIEKEFKPDFLLIDSRTGVTEMGGLCTSLLPDKVVFLITNNRENIEGARQILRGIGKVERLPGQKPIEVTFALTRIPFPSDDDENESEKEREKEIVKNMQDFLNEPVGDLGGQLDVRDICVLHSNRDLELSESVRMDQEGVTEETPLLHDYLKLFSKIIPEEIITPKIDALLDGITANILNDPDKTQKELEDLVRVYPHHRTLEKLINFYILRNEGREKILNAFHKLWKIFEIEDPDMLSKYVSLFMKRDVYPRSIEEPNFELEIIKKYLELNPKNRDKIEMKLADAYEEYGDAKTALKHYLQLLERIKEKNKVINKILNIYLCEELYEDALKLITKYHDIIDSNASLILKKVEILFKAGNILEVGKILENETIKSNLFDEDPRLYIGVMNKLRKSDEVDKKLNEMVANALKKDSLETLYRVGTIFYSLNRADEFKNKISGYHKADEILYKLKLNTEYRERRLFNPF